MVAGGREVEGWGGEGRGNVSSPTISTPNQPLLHCPSVLVDKTNFGLLIYNHADSYRFEASSYCQLNEHQFISAFHSQCRTVQ